MHNSSLRLYIKFIKIINNSDKFNNFNYFLLNKVKTITINGLKFMKL